MKGSQRNHACTCGSNLKAKDCCGSINSKVPFTRWPERVPDGAIIRIKETKPGVGFVTVYHRSPYHYRRLRVVPYMLPMLAAITMGATAGLGVNPRSRF